MSKKVAWLDTETTGLSATKNDVIQVGIILEVEGEEVGRMESKCQPHDWDDISPYACDVHGMSVEDMKGFQAPNEMRYDIGNAFNDHITVSDQQGFIMAGYNIKFDWRMLKGFYDKESSPETFLGMFTGEMLDVMKMFKAYSANRPSIPNNKLITAAAHFGYKFDAHDALEDIDVTRKIYHDLIEAGIDPQIGVC